MADPAQYRPKPGTIPVDAGVYRFLDAEGRVIYVGKAKSLRPRLSSYFQDVAALHPRTRSMVQTGARVEWTVVANEVEALQLEYSWIKEFDPRFNVKYRDDKSYPYLAVTLNEEYPRALVLRGEKRKGIRYFGPYAHAWAIRESLDLLLRTFPVRTCTKGVFARARQSGRPCLLGYIDKCAAPCVSRIDAERHRLLALDLCEFLGGDTRKFVRRLETEMKEAAAALQFESAARIRDNLGALRSVMEKNAVVLGDDTDADVFALVDDEFDVAVQVFLVRGGRIRGQRGWIAQKDASSTGDLVEVLLQQVYGNDGGESVPKEVLVPELPPDPEAVAKWLSERRGSRVSLRVPSRGDKKALLETVRKNAEQSLQRHRLTRAGDVNARSQAMRSLQDALDLDDAPLRIECFDISHVQGTNVVGSMVVFEDGIPRKSDYRTFAIRGDIDGRSDDTAAMKEVLTRRFRTRTDADSVPTTQPSTLHPAVNVAASNAASASRKPARFAYAPQLLVVDGGLPQVNAAAEVLAQLGITDVAVVGLAKRLEEVWVPGNDYPVIMPRSSEGLYLLQRVRDEAHRFAVRFHRKRRSAAMTTSALDTVPGLGQARRAALLKHFGSLKKIKSATPEQLQEVPGIGAALATTISAHLAGESGPEAPTIDLLTGEILETSD